jgi:hypothetical protein
MKKVRITEKFTVNGYGEIVCNIFKKDYVITNKMCAKYFSDTKFNGRVYLTKVRYECGIPVTKGVQTNFTSLPKGAKVSNINETTNIGGFKISNKAFI